LGRCANKYGDSHSQMKQKDSRGDYLTRLWAIFPHSLQL
jgi:hypothetical protein